MKNLARVFVALMSLHCLSIFAFADEVFVDFEDAALVEANFMGLHPEHFFIYPYGGRGNSGSVSTTWLTRQNYIGQSFDFSKVNASITVSTFFHLLFDEPSNYPTGHNYGEVYLVSSASDIGRDIDKAFVKFRTSYTSAGERIDKISGGSRPAPGGSFPGFDRDYPSGTFKSGHWYELKVTFTNLGAMIRYDVILNEYDDEGVNFVQNVVQATETTVDSFGLTNDTEVFSGYYFGFYTVDFADDFSISATTPDIPGLPSGIDSGASSAYTTAGGVTFEGDYGRTGGIVRSSSGQILNTDDDALYHTRVVAPIGEDVIYLVTPPVGVTEMDISGHFNEHYHQSAGARLIDVTIRCPGSAEPWNTGVKVEDELDIFSEAGGKNMALVRNWGAVDVTGGEVEITLTASAAGPDAALISAIEFAESPNIDIPGLPNGIDSGASSAYTTAGGVTFEADYGRTGGIVRSSSGQILNTDDDALYHTRVVAPIGEDVIYLVTPPVGVTEMDISGHFNEHYHQSAGARLIDVTIRCPGSAEPWNTGVQVEDELDIFSEAGGKNMALVRTWGAVDVTGGEVEITLTASAAGPDAALISAIEFSDAGSSPGTLSIPELQSPGENTSMDNGCNGYFTGYDDPLIWDFTWSEVEHATDYQISILRDGTEVISDTTINPEYRYYCFHDSEEISECMIQDPRSESWTWRVRASANGTFSEWSQERRLNIDVPEIDCIQDYPFMIFDVELTPPSPAVLTPGSRVDIRFKYWTPYAQKVFISAIPRTNIGGYVSPSPGAQIPDPSLYPAAYDDSGIGESYFEIDQNGIQVDEIFFTIKPEGGISEYNDFTNVDYYFSTSPGE